MGWTEELDTRLRTLWGDLARSTRQIADELGVSKNAAVGRAHRLKLPARPTPIRRLDNAPVPAGPRSGAAAVEAAKRRAEPRAGRVTLGDFPVVPCLMERTPRLSFSPHHTCQFIAGKPAGVATIFCDAPVLRGSSYCPPHHARCWEFRPAKTAAAA